MKPPNCKVCNRAHWTYDGHSVSDTTVPGYVSEMARGALGGDRAPQPAGRYDVVQRGRINVTVTKEEGSVTEKPCNTCNKPVTGYGKVCNACRQRAYRQRRSD